MIYILEYFAIFLFGVILGNFTTTIFYRLPRGIILYGFNENSTKPPFCSKCKHKLKFYEYLPVLSWISTRGTCNYCNKTITSSYFYLEILGGLFSVLCSLIYGKDIEYYLIMLIFYLLATLAFFLALEHKTAFKQITTALICAGALYRTLNDQSILLWVSSLGIASIASLYILKNSLDSSRKKEFVHLILPASIWLYYPWIFIYAIIVLIIMRMPKNFYKLGIIALMLIETLSLLLI